MHVAQTALAASGNNNFLACFCEVGNNVTSLEIFYDSTYGNTDNKVFTALAVHLLAHTLCAVLGNELMLEPEVLKARQILRSGTSIGANVRESRFAQSKADFISKLSIALKESSETQYWLELLSATALLTKRQYASIKTDLDWLVGTLVNVIKSSKRNLKRSPQHSDDDLTI